MRIFGFTPDEALALNKELQRAIGQITRDFLTAHNLDKTLRDFTGVLPPEVAPHHAGYRPPDLQRYDVDRPESDAQFIVREAALASEIFDTHERVKITSVAHGLYELSYPGGAGVPSRCLAFIGAPGEPDRTVDNSWVVALIGLPRGGTPPTLVFGSLTDAVRKALLADTAAASLRLLDIEPDEFSPTAALRIAEVLPGNEHGSFEWVPDPRLPFVLQRSLREALQIYGAWRRRLSVEDEEALAALGRRDSD
jgi:hypothetical protein